MKIAFISMFKRGFGGGEGRAAYELAQRFASRHDVVFVCPNDRTALCLDESGLRVLGIKSAGEGHVCVPILSQKNVNKLYDFLDQFEPDVVHAHEPYSLGLIGQVWAKMHNVPFVHTAHVLPSKALSFGAAEFLKVLKSPVTGSMIRRLLVNFYENCDAVIALNHSAADDIARFGHRGKVFMIPNGRDLKVYGVCRDAELSLETKVLTFVGFVSRRKNQRYLIEVLKHLPKKYELQIIGEVIDPRYGQQLDDLIRENHLFNVMFTGPVEHRDIPSYLEKTHVFVSASKMEVQSLVVIEALASGTPVVGLSNETLEELVDERVGFRLASSSSPKEFAQRVDQICGLSQTEYAKMCQNARHRVQRFDWTNVQELTIEAYESLLRERPSVENEPNAGVAKIIALIRSEEIRKTLTQRVALLNKTLRRKVHRGSRLSLFSMIKEAKRISSPTWFCVGLTLLLSLVGYLLLRPAILVRIRGLKAREVG